MKIAVDAMGGDHAPQAIVEGVLLAREEFPKIEFQLYGSEPAIRKHLTNETNIKIIHTDEKIENDDEPVRAIRRKKQASMVLAAQAVKDGQADAVFSAGNTGALLAAGLFIIGRIKNVQRPGLMTTMPVFGQADAGFDFIDMGANADNEAKHIHQYAVLASYYAKNVRGIQDPRVALLNNGTEESKGSQLTKETFALLASEQQINFIGNIEARDLLTGKADVIVTDGFTGNAVLKSTEGAAQALMTVLKESILAAGIKGKIGALLLKDALKNMKEQLDYSKYGGAILFGLKAPVIKTHGSTGPEAVYYTIKQISNILESNVIADLVTAFEEKEGERL